MNKTGVSKTFILLMLLFFFGASGVFYSMELIEMEGTTVISAKVVAAKNIPRICVLKLRAENHDFSRRIISTTVPSWDSKKRGDRVLIRINPQDPSNVKIDRLIYTHRTSIGILGGGALLLISLLIAKMIKK